MKSKGSFGLYARLLSMYRCGIVADLHSYLQEIRAFSRGCEELSGECVSTQTMSGRNPRQAALLLEEHQPTGCRKQQHMMPHIHSYGGLHEKYREKIRLRSP